MSKTVMAGLLLALFLKSFQYLQICEFQLKDRKTTNNSLAHFYRSNNVEDIVRSDYKQIDNLMILCQKDPVENYYATSFEEAFILTNSQNSIVKSVLEKVKPNVYKNIINDGGIVKNSFKLQKNYLTLKATLQMHYYTKF